MFTIKEVTQRLGMTVHTVRHYCDKGLVPNLSHDENGNRLFDEESLNWLQAAKFLRDSGMTIAEIHHYFELCQAGLASLNQRHDLMEELRAKAEKDLAQVQYRLDCLTKQVAVFDDIKKGIMTDSTNPMTWK